MPTSRLIQDLPLKPQFRRPTAVKVDGRLCAYIEEQLLKSLQ